MRRKVIMSVVVLVLAISMISGCRQKESKTAAITQTEENTNRKLNISEIRPELIFGDYLVDRSSIIAGRQDYDAFMDGMGVVDYDNDGENVKLSDVPIDFSAGRYGWRSEKVQSFYDMNYPTEEELQNKCDELVDKYGEEGVTYFHNYRKLLDYPYISATYIFVPEDGFDAVKTQIATMEGFYKISGTTVTIYIDEPDPVTYELKYEKPALSFNFDFINGLNMAISNNGSSVIMVARQFSEAKSNLPYCAIGYINDASEALDDIIYIRGAADSIYRPQLIFSDGRKTAGTKLDLRNDGTFTLSWKGIEINSLKMEEGPGEIEGEYIYPGNAGIILVVDGKTYYYTYTESDYFGSVFDSVIAENKPNEEDEDAKNKQSEIISELIQTQISIKNDLMEAFNNAGIETVIDKKSGEVKADDSILFGVDEAEVSEAGEEYLDKFIEVYTDVISSYVQDGYIAKIEISGHTDTSGSFEHNLELSKARAKNVEDYCLKKQPSLKGVIESDGYAYEYPILDDNGEVDMKASRRVVFAFKMGAGNK